MLPSTIIEIKQLLVFFFQSCKTDIRSRMIYNKCPSRHFRLNIWQFWKKQTGKISLEITCCILAWPHMWHLGTFMLAGNINYIYLWLKNGGMLCWRYVQSFAKYCIGFWCVARFTTAAVLIYLRLVPRQFFMSCFLLQVLAGGLNNSLMLHF